jgi:alpha-N-acetylglucosaminidase
MKVILLILTIFSLAAIAKAEDAATTSAREVLDRVAPKLSSKVDLKLIDADNGRDVFEIEQSGDRIIFRGNNAVSLTSAAGWYLKHVANCELSWCGNQLALPDPLPKVNQKIRQTCPFKYRVYFNYCTLAYTGTWWDWNRWQHEIDFMALQGINMPLSVTGLEGTWYNTLLKLNFTDEQARQFLVGPCYLPWQWMANIEGFGGPLPKSWIDSHVKLEQQILTQERSLGMMPIQQGFCGNVPRSMKQMFPTAAIMQKPNWCGFTGTAQLDPLDPLFPKVAATFYEEQKKLFGQSHYYGTDPFHESSPPKPGNQYLHDVATTIQKTMTDADPDAIWCMQSWSLREPIVQAIAKDKLLILDIGSRYQSDQNFWSYPFTAGIISNFGGRTRMFGNLAGMARNPFDSATKKAANCIGMGIFPEAIDNNPAYFGMAFDMIWRNGGVDVNQWLGEYARRRYGVPSESAAAAWQGLLKTVYSPANAGASSILTARPALNVKMSDPNWGLASPYDAEQLLDAWKSLLVDADKLKASDAYQYDVADVGRQLFSDLGLSIHADFMQAYIEKDAAKMQDASDRFIELENDTDRLVGTRPELSFEKWQQDAIRWATTEDEKKLYTFNAAMLVTQWGATGDPQLFEYAWREWSGLLRDYYGPRWKQFHNFLIDQVKQNIPYSEDKLPQTYGRPALRSTKFLSGLADWELNWIHSDKNYPPFKAGDSAAVACAMLAKYEPAMRKAFATNPNKRLADLRSRISVFTPTGAVAFMWTPKSSSEQWSTWKIDVTKLLVDTGSYSVILKQDKGGKPLEIRSVSVLQNGSKASEDLHDESTGANRQATYKIKRDDPIFNAKFELDIDVRTDGIADSHGEVVVRHAE